MTAGGRGRQSKKTDALIEGAAPALLVLTLFLARFQLMRQAGLGLSQAWHLGLVYGLIQDTALCLLAWALASALGHLPGLRFRVVWIPLSVFIWLATTANVFYHEYFGSRLEAWVLRYHLHDLTDISGSAGAMGFSPWPAAGALALSLSIWAAFRRDRGRPRPRPVLWIASGLIIALVLGQARPRKQGTIMSEQIFAVWWNTYLSSQRAMGSAEMANFKPMNDRTAEEILGRYRGGPLFHPISTPPSEVRRERRLLGLPEDRPPNIVLIFGESARYYELGNPAIGPKIFPGLRRVIRDHGILFAQSYSSSLTAGQTVRGQFSALCSMLPDVLGPATYLAHPDLKVRCLEGLLKDSGYHTFWINGFHGSFHNSNLWETGHGTETFLDMDWLLGRGVKERVGDWGLGDLPVLGEALKLFLETSDRPIFANILTASTHHPFSVLPGYEADPRLAADVESHGGSRAHLSRLMYLDHALSTFVDQLFASPIGDRTLVVFLADHSILEDGPRDLPPVAQKDFGFRIPIILLTKNMRHPEIREVQAHQIDIAPTLAAVAGAKGEVAWLGRNLLAPGATGSPWVYWDPDGISFRSGQLLCQGRGASEPACWNLAPGQDPLFSAELEPITPPPGMTALMGDAVQASGVLIDHGRLAAPPRQSDPSH